MRNKPKYEIGKYLLYDGLLAILLEFNPETEIHGDEYGVKVCYADGTPKGEMRYAYDFELKPAPSTLLVCESCNRISPPDEYHGSNLCDRCHYSKYHHRYVEAEAEMMDIDYSDIDGD